MLNTLSIIVPIFALIFVGFGAGRTRLFSEEGGRGLTNFVLYIAIPALLFRAMARLDMSGNAAILIVPAYFSAVLLLFAATLLLSRTVLKQSLEEQALMAMGAVFSNTVLIGFPIIYMTFGERGLLGLLLIISVHPLLLISLPTILVEIHRGRTANSPGNLAKTARAVLITLIRNPIILAMVCGLAFRATGLDIVKIVDDFLVLVGRAAAPVALFAVGASLSRYRIAGDLRDISIVVALKLIALPLFVYISTRHVFGLDPLWVAVATTNAATPIGINVFALARQYNLYVQRSASAILISTGVGWLTMALVVGLLAHKP